MAEASSSVSPQNDQIDVLLACVTDDFDKGTAVPNRPMNLETMTPLLGVGSLSSRIYIDLQGTERAIWANG